MKLFAVAAILLTGLAGEAYCAEKSITLTSTQLDAITAGETCICAPGYGPSSGTFPNIPGLTPLPIPSSLVSPPVNLQEWNLGPNIIPLNQGSTIWKSPA
jgi:hypothetical protein